MLKRNWRPLLAVTLLTLFGVGMFVGIWWTAPARSDEPCDIVGKASWYGLNHHGRITRSGERFDQWGLTAAMPSVSHIGERWRVRYGGNSVVVRINDTGGFAKYTRVIDLSRGAARAIGMEEAGVGVVCLVKL